MSFIITWQWDESQIPAYMAAVEVQAELAAYDGAVIVQTFARDFVAVDTGSLQESIDVEPVEPKMYSVNAGNVDGGYRGGGRGGKTAGSPIDYADAQEYGGNNISGQPYMTPAAENGLPAVLSAAEARLAAIE